MVFARVMLHVLSRSIALTSDQVAVDRLIQLSIYTCCIQSQWTQSQWKKLNHHIPDTIVSVSYPMCFKYTYYHIQGEGLYEIYKPKIEGLRLYKSHRD